MPLRDASLFEILLLSVGVVLVIFHRQIGRRAAAQQLRFWRRITPRAALGHREVRALGMTYLVGGLLFIAVALLSMTGVI